eukprot:CAMPEP_0117538462 /NCGR_PEP_ID=MMETSP0784-20121206/42491_1 /TAXON_ID=39447 /ORGANISM="" /LENGTH=426 /DNA_ID=CAMNT_0005335077 /DNA_START=90 /DNA_END=1370 /DNA_ORIENTATION=+
MMFPGAASSLGGANGVLGGGTITTVSPALAANDSVDPLERKSLIDPHAFTISGNSLTEIDPKQKLNYQCQKLCPHPISKRDIIYNTNRVGPGIFQSIVKLTMLDNVEYAGEVCCSAKESERAAAKQALEAQAATFANVDPSLGFRGRFNKRKLVGSPATGWTVAWDAWDDDFTWWDGGWDGSWDGWDSWDGGWSGRYWYGAGYGGAAGSARRPKRPRTDGGDGKDDDMPTPGPDSPCGWTPDNVKEQVTKAAERATKHSKPVSYAEYWEEKLKDNPANPALTDKVRLNSVCMRIADRALQKGDTTYECRCTPEGYQATVTLLCLPDEYSNACWAGEVKSTKQAAEQSAATIALQQIKQDARLMEMANNKPPGFRFRLLRAMFKGKGKGTDGTGETMPPGAQGVGQGGTMQGDLAGDDFTEDVVFLA